MLLFYINSILMFYPKICFRKQETFNAMHLSEIFHKWAHINQYFFSQPVFLTFLYSIKDLFLRHSDVLIEYYKNICTCVIIITSLNLLFVNIQFRWHYKAVTVFSDLFFCIFRLCMYLWILFFVFVRYSNASELIWESSEKKLKYWVP